MLYLLPSLPHPSPVFLCLLCLSLSLSLPLSFLISLALALSVFICLFVVVSLLLCLSLSDAQYGSVSRVVCISQPLALPIFLSLGPRHRRSMPQIIPSHPLSPTTAATAKSRWSNRSRTRSWPPASRSPRVSALRIRRPMACPSSLTRTVSPWPSAFVLRRSLERLRRHSRRVPRTRRCRSPGWPASSATCITLLARVLRPLPAACVRMLRLRS